MKIPLVKGLPALPFLLLLVFLLLGVGCFGDMEQLPVSSPDTLAALLVPDTNLELYAYAKQERPTIIPSKIINLSHDIRVDSLAVWGLPSEKGLVFGAGLTLTNANDASEIYNSIKFEEDGWKILRENKIYVVRGSGVAAESLKLAIANNGFKYYSNRSVLEAIAMLPRSIRAKMVAIGVAKPSKQVLEFSAGYIGKKNFEQVDRVLRLLNPDVVIVSLHSPHQINVAKAVEVFEKGSSASALDVGMLALVKSSLPGFVVSPVTRNLLKDNGFLEKKVGDYTVYRGSWSAPDGSTIPILVRIEGSYIFVAISGQEPYAETLITNIYR